MCEKASRLIVRDLERERSTGGELRTIEFAMVERFVEKGCRILMMRKSPSQRDSLQVFFLSYRPTV